MRRPDLAAVHTVAWRCGMACDDTDMWQVLYFHENEVQGYPVRNEKERDFQLGWIQIVSAMCADVVAFNSAYNRDAFLSGLTLTLTLTLQPRRLPDRLHHPRTLPPSHAMPGIANHINKIPERPYR